VRQIFHLSSSLRSESLETTLSRVRPVAEKLGISRVTDITRLDLVGVPVYASIRPVAQPGSLCVNAGKGVHSMEARVGAYMEAVEFAFAEFNRASLEVRRVPARQVYEGRVRSDSILDFCPRLGTEIDLDTQLACVDAEDICTGERFAVPAELVFLPFPATLEPAYFGSSSNGLCSGNSVLEATVHGLAELIERDVHSFQSVLDSSMLVDERGLPPPVEAIRQSLSSCGLNLYIRYAPNGFEIPYFNATVADPANPDPIYINGGYGCHPSKRVALTRAVCEALQSRLSFIHGGRDDLVHRHKQFTDMPSSERRAYASRLLSKVSRRGATVQFEEILDREEQATDLESALALLLESLRLNGFERVLRVVYTERDYPVQVARVLVPRIESFNEKTQRVGTRLRDYVRDM
jgi:ribosomal protein S12 methylthiotransferase accessory factor